MTIPANLTHAEVGAYLVAIGHHMVEHDVCADAVLAPDMLKDLEYAENLAGEMVMANFYGTLDTTRALDIVTSLTLAEAIDFNEAGK